jgi:O-antigen/teichoic acid export membrane protein
MIQKTNIASEIKRLLKHGSVYGVAGILSRLVGFLMIPVYTHYLSPSDYGINELVGLTTEIIGIVLGLGIADAIYRFYYDKSESNSSNTVFSTACIGVTVLSFFLLGFIALFSKPIAAVVLEESGQYIYIVLALATLWFNQQVNFIYTYFRITESSSKYLVVSLLKLVTALSLNIFFIVGLKMGVMGLFISNCITAAFFAVCFYPFLLRRVGIAFSWATARKMLRFSLPVIPSNLASLAVNASDRYFIRFYMSIAEAGIYGLGYKLGNVVFYLVRVPFMQIWDPRKYALYSQGAPKELFAQVATYFAGMMIFTGLGISIFVSDIIEIISPAEYWSAARYVPAVTLCYIIYAMDHHVGFGILVAKKTEYWTLVNLSMGAINIGLNFLLIPSFGVWGAVGATFVSLTYKVSCLYFIGKRFFDIPFEWLRLTSMLVVGALLYAIRFFSVIDDFVVALFYDALLCSLFPLLLWFLNVITRQEKQTIKSFFKNIYRRKSISRAVQP